MPKAATLTPDQVREWRARLDASRDIVKPIVTAGQQNVSRQRNLALTTTPMRDTVTVPLDFAYVEQKKASLFFQTPDILAEAKQPAYESAAPIYSAVMNQKLGIGGVNAKAAMFEVLSDILAATGYGVIKVGYETVVDGTKPVATGKMIPDPSAGAVQQPGAILGLSQPPAALVPEMVDAPNILSETYYFRRISPGKFRAPRDFRGSDFDDGAWIAWRFEEDVPDGGGTTSDEDDQLLLARVPSATPLRKRRGDEVWYKASLFDADAKHPELIRTFTIYDDDPRGVPPERRDSPFQRWVLPNQPPSPVYVPGGQLMGMRGFPLQVFTLHYVSDVALPPPMATMSRQIVDEVGTGRTQMIQRRDRSLPQVAYDATRVLPEQLEKIERNDLNGYTGFNGPVTDDMFRSIEKGQFGRENFTFDEICHRDLDQIWAMGSGGGVIRGDGSETATKSNQIQTAIDTRSESDRTRILEGFVKAVTKLAALVQLFSDEQDYVRVVGPDGAKRLIPWNKDTIAGEFAFSAKPDSHVRVDAAQRRQQMLQAYNQTRKDPNCNEQYLITQLATELGLDPMRLYKPTPPKVAEKPSVSWALKIDDFLGPGAPVAVEIARQSGIVISHGALEAAKTLGAIAAAMAAAQQPTATGPQPPQPHGGAAEVTSPVNRHNEQITGGTPGVSVQ